MGAHGGASHQNAAACRTIAVGAQRRIATLRGKIDTRRSHDVFAGNQAELVAGADSHVIDEFDFSAQDRDGSSHREGVSQCDVGAVARLAQGQSCQSVAKVPACGAECVGEIIGTRLDAQGTRTCKGLADGIRCIVLQDQCASIDGGCAAVSVVGGQGQGVDAQLRQCACATDRIRHGHVVRPVKSKHRVVGHSTGA